MIEWLLSGVPLLKAVHIAALSVWCGGLLTIPLMFSRKEMDPTQLHYMRLREATHLTYTLGVTPAAVIAVIAGTWLIFLRESFSPWLYAKLVCVAVLVLVHAWIGHLLVLVAERPGEYRIPNALLLSTAVLIPVVAILLLVLAKPDLSWIEFPGWMLEPRGNQLPLDVPS